MTPPLPPASQRSELGTLHGRVALMVQKPTKRRKRCETNVDELLEVKGRYSYARVSKGP